MENRAKKSMSENVADSRTKSEHIELIIEAAKGGELWGRVRYGDDLLTTVGNTAEELQDKIREQLRDFYRVEIAALPEFELKYDLEAFFELHAALNITEVAKLAGLNPSLLRQYKNGIKHPSKDQVKRIEDAIHKLGRQLLNIELLVA